jgi:hypothetical protein
MPAFRRQVDKQNNKMIALISATPPEDLQTELKLHGIRRDSAVTNLKTVAGVLDELEVDSSDYTSLVLQVSGDVSTGILETGVWANLLRQWGQNTWA